MTPCSSIGEWMVEARRAPAIASRRSGGTITKPRRIAGNTVLLKLPM